MQEGCRWAEEGSMAVPASMSLMLKACRSTVPSRSPSCRVHSYPPVLTPSCLPLQALLLLLLKC